MCPLPKKEEQTMKKGMMLTVVMLAVNLLATGAFAKDAAKPKGEELFKQNCASCHPEGGNIVNPQDTLHKKDMARGGVKTAKDIIKKMRNPGPGMTKFDVKTLPDKDAKAIAEYILKTFK
jgi:cytochrome c6